MNSIYGRWLGQMRHSGDFARWPHLGPIRPMARGGHLGPLSYVYGYRGGVGRSGVAQDTNGDDGIEIRARDGRYELIIWRCTAGFVPKSAISEICRCGSTEKRAIGGKNLSAVRFLWAILGGVQSGWEQFGAVKKWALLIARSEVQLVAL